MLFNSVQFAIFFPIVTILYFWLPHSRRWILLLAASCVFYMAFVPLYILILLVTITIDYYAAIWIEECRPRARKPILVASILSTCGVLFVFKYFNFFVHNWEMLAKALGWNYPLPALKIMLPIGLSFHTFQSLSYVIEVYRGNQAAERHFGIYSLYVMFYPQLVAGPIERPQNLLHQFREEKSFVWEDVTSGLRQMAWGLFKKVVIADRLSIYVNAVFDNPTKYSGSALTLATVGFAYQIYCDFSGYSDIAIGSARVMGFRLMKNFDRPYAASSISEFWQRWHISLSGWFRDYVYFPLGGSRVQPLLVYRNLFVTFLISGLWHGANWTFVFWGALNGIYLIGGRIVRSASDKFTIKRNCLINTTLARLCAIASTFALVCVAWIFFRASSMSEAWYIVSHVGVGWSWMMESVSGFSVFDGIVALCAITLLEVCQWVSANKQSAYFDWTAWTPLRWQMDYLLVGGIIVFGVFEGSKFVYFQF